MAPPVPVPRQPRYHSLDLWRGVACLAVVFYHATLTELTARHAAGTAADAGSVTGFLMWLTNQGWLGVPLFFVISGYCIAATADATRRRPVTMWTYFVRRFRRIFPPYWAILAFTVALITLVDYVLFPGFLSSEPRAQLRPWWFSPSQWIGNLTLTETWRPHLFGDIRGHIVGQSWTLCYEEQFYAVVGALLLAARRHLFLGALVTTAGCLAVQVAALAGGASVQGFFFDGSWFLFAAGILVYYTLNYADGRRRWALGAAVAVLPLISLGFPALFQPGTTAGFVFAGLLCALRPWDEAIVAVKAFRPLAFCGTICYSMYLVHSIIVRIITKAFYGAGVQGDLTTLLVVLPVSVAASVASGWAFYTLVERRFLNQPQAGAPSAATGFGRGVWLPTPQPAANAAMRGMLRLFQRRR